MTFSDIIQLGVIVLAVFASYLDLNLKVAGIKKDIEWLKKFISPIKGEKK